VSNFSLGNTYRVQNIESVAYALENLKAEGIVSDYIITNSDGDANKQIADVQDLITAGCDALVITAQTPTNLNAIIEEAMAKGIVVTTFNSQPSTDDVTCKVIENEVQFGELGGTWLVDKLGKGAKDIIVLSGIAGNDVNDMRYQEPKRMFAEAGYNTRGEIFGTWDYADSKVGVEQLLAAHSNIDAVFSQGGAMTLAAIEAFIAAGRPLVPMAGESNSGLLKAWKDNVGKDNFDCVAPIVNDRTGTIAMEQAIKALQGEDVPKIINLPYEVITFDNIDSFIKPDLPDSYWVGSALPDEKIKELFSK
jgi:ribose transport system substrate-binding protein